MHYLARATSSLQRRRAAQEARVGRWSTKHWASGLRTERKHGFVMTMQITSKERDTNGFTKEQGIDNPIPTRSHGTRRASKAKLSSEPLLRTLKRPSHHIFLIERIYNLFKKVQPTPKSKRTHVRRHLRKTTHHRRKGKRRTGGCLWTSCPLRHHVSKAATSIHRLQVFNYNDLCM